MWSSVSFHCFPHRTPRDGGAALHLQRLHWPPLYTAGSICPSDLQGAAAQGSQACSQVERSESQLFWAVLSGQSRAGRWQWRNRELSAFNCREEGDPKLGGSDLHERGGWAGGEDRTQRHDHPGDMDELLPERQLLLNNSCGCLVRTTEKEKKSGLWNIILFTEGSVG